MNRSERAKEIREAVRQHGRAGRGNPYPERLKQDAIEYWGARKREGVSAMQVSRELGICVLTLARWSKPPASPLLPVVIDAAPTTGGGIVVRGPRGLLIEGLDIAALAALLRELS
jgi:hypothetical protein